VPTRTQVTSAPVSQLPAPPKLMLIDGHSIAYRAFFALPVENFSTQTGVRVHLDADQCVA
jgi:DNA polymerase-1